MNGSDNGKSLAGVTPVSGRQQFKSVAGGKALDNARKQTSSPVDTQNRRQAQPPTLKAWQGPNPITQRSASITPNGGEKPLPRPPVKSNGSAHADKQPNATLAYLMANFIGLDVILTHRSGERFSGIYSSDNTDCANKQQYFLKMVKKMGGLTTPQTNGDHEVPVGYIGDGPDHTMRFDVADTIDLRVNNVSLATAAVHQNGVGASGFRTDAEISSRDPSQFRERELQRWEPNADVAIDLSLDSSTTAGWDQFAANERLYGVQSTYDEDIYTTAIDRNDPRYRQIEARAAQIAREIESSTPADAHVAEERIVNADKGDGLDEESKYSGVIRDQANLPKRGANSYIPPSQRPITSAPTVPGAPFDPAIVSMTKQSSSPVPPAPKEAADESSVKQASPSADAVKPTAQISSTTITTTPTPNKKVESTTEDHVRSTADAFRQFANGEKLRLRQAQEAKQEAKRFNARAEKNVKLNDLKKFSENFKLSSRVPDDLIPILAKTRDKQMEIQRKAEDAAREQELKAKEKGKERPAASIPVTTPSAASSGPVAGDGRAGSSQQSRARVHQHLRAPIVPIQPSGRGAAVQQRGPSSRANGALTQSIASTDLRIPTGPASTASVSPTTIPKLNVNAFEFRPSAVNFTPAAASPSPQRKPAAQIETPSTFFAEGKAPSQIGKNDKSIDEKFDVLKHLAEEVPAEQKKTLASNGGIPQPYRTGPTWPVETSNQNVSYKDSFPKTQIPHAGSTAQLPAGPASHMPHSHQLPPHLQTPQGAISAPRPFYNPQANHGHHFDPRMQQFGPAGSVQSSPRFPQAQMAFNSHMQPPLPQFNGQPMQGYHMSPSMQYRQMQMPAGTPVMMMPNQQVPQMRNGFPQGPQFAGQQVGGQMMVHNPSNGYVNGPLPQPHSYSPMPPHAQPHMPQMHHGGPGNFPGGPRPPMMQHSGSHQGYQSPMFMQQQAQYGSSPGQSQSYHLAHQQRQMSSNQFPQMTPRQQAAIPQHSSPSMIPAGQGDEGK